MKKTVVRILSMAAVTLTFIAMVLDLVPGVLMLFPLLAVAAMLLKGEWLCASTYLLLPLDLLGCMLLPVALYRLYLLADHLTDQPLRSPEGQRLLRDSAVWLLLFAVSLAMLPVVCHTISVLDNDDFLTPALSSCLWIWGIAAVCAAGAVLLLALLRRAGGRLFSPRWTEPMRATAMMMAAAIIVCCMLLAFLPTIGPPPPLDTSPANVLLSLSSLSLPTYSQEQYYSCGDFQDITEYGVYRYPPLTDGQLQDSRLRRAAEDDIAMLADYLDDFSSWVKVHEGSRLAIHFDFGAACLNAGDWFLLEDKADTDSFYHPFENYSLWLFDRGTDTLYYFHNDI